MAAADLCGRCLIVVNVTTPVSVRYDHHTDWAQDTTDPEQLAAWVEQHCERSGGDALFSIGPTSRRFVPFSTWHGDPVCSWHLWQLTEKEQRVR